MVAPALMALASVLTPFAARGATRGTLSAAPSAANFGSVAIGMKNSQTFQIKNSGGAKLVLSGATLTGTGFAISNLSVPIWLAPGATTNLTVTFAPTTTGSVAGMLTIKSNAGLTLTIPVSGTGIGADLSLSLSSSSLNFGNEMVGGSSSLGVVLTNSGNSSITLSQISVTGGGFSTTGGLGGATIAAGQSATLNVVFAPQTTGTVTGTVTITSNAANSPQSIAMSGTGVSNTIHSVVLGWSASASTDVVGYYVYRSTGSGSSYSRMNASPTAAITYTDGSVTSGATYYYTVTAVSSIGAESAHSSEVIAAIP